VSSSLPNGWHPCGNATAALEAELDRELTSGHPLFGKAVMAAARRLDCDDILFASGDGTIVAMVHLTMSGRPEGAAWPWTEVFKSWEAWRAYLATKPDDWHL